MSTFPRCVAASAAFALWFAASAWAGSREALKEPTDAPAKKVAPAQDDAQRAPDRADEDAGAAGKHYEKGMVIVSVTQWPARDGKGARRKETDTLKVKGRKSRLDMPEMSLIFDGSTGESVMILHATKTYRRTTAEQRKKEVPLTAEERGVDLEKESRELKPTGKTRKIGGYTAHAYLKPDTLLGGPPNTIWVVKDFPHFEEFVERLKNSQDETSFWHRPELRPPGFIIRSEGWVRGGGKVITTQSVRAEAVDDAEFDIPKEYTEERT